jgi:hypothetical protein
MNTDAKLENTPGVFLEHFDVAPGRVSHEQVLKAARQVAEEKGWMLTPANWQRSRRGKPLQRAA